MGEFWILDAHLRFRHAGGQQVEYERDLYTRSPDARPAAAHRRVDADPLQRIGHFRCLSITTLPPYAPLCKRRTTTRFPGAAQHVAQRSGALQTRDRNEHRVRSDRGSAVHRFALHRVRETRSQGWLSAAKPTPYDRLVTLRFAHPTRRNLVLDTRPYSRYTSTQFAH